MSEKRNCMPEKRFCMPKKIFCMAEFFQIIKIFRSFNRNNKPFYELILNFGMQIFFFMHGKLIFLRHAKLIFRHANFFLRVVFF
jgi:hypothetical protein